MAWAKIDDMKLPNGDYVTVCLSHERVVCRQCCVDFSFELNDGDCISSDEKGIFSLGANCLVPRDVSFTQVANSSYGRRQPAGKQETGLPDMVSSKGLGDQNISPHVIDLSRWAGVPERTAPSGKIFPAQFNHSMKALTTPQELFSAGSKRFYNRDNKFEMLIYTD
ncbi:RNase H domain-containing protein, partial [Colletotrichum plurivorum]